MGRANVYNIIVLMCMRVRYQLDALNRRRRRRYIIRDLYGIGGYRQSVRASSRRRFVIIVFLVFDKTRE